MKTSNSVTYFRTMKLYDHFMPDVPQETNRIKDIREVYTFYFIIRFYHILLVLYIGMDGVKGMFLYCDRPYIVHFHSGGMRYMNSGKGRLPL